MLTGMLAAELRVRNAVMPESFKQRSTSGKGFLRNAIRQMSGLVISAMTSMQPTNTKMS